MCCYRACIRPGRNGVTAAGCSSCPAFDLSAVPAMRLHELTGACAARVAHQLAVQVSGAASSNALHPLALTSQVQHAGVCRPAALARNAVARLRWMVGGVG